MAKVSTDLSCVLIKERNHACCVLNISLFPGFFHAPSTGFDSPTRDVDQAYARLSNREAAALAEGPASRMPVATVMSEHPPTRAPTSTKPQVLIRPKCP